MDHWVEERCQAVRLALRLAGFPTPWDAERLVHWLEGCIEVHYAPVSRGAIRYRADGSAAVTLPAGGEGEALEHAQVEECAHYLLGDGLGSYLRSVGQGGSLAARSDAKDEALVRKFLHAWFLPSDLLRRCRPQEVAEESRQDWETIRARYAQLRRLPPELDAPPRWSAARDYELRLRCEPPMTLQVFPRGARVAEYQFLVTRSFEDTAFQVQADLVALTPREFRLKYHGDALRPGRPLEIPFVQLRRWAGLPAPQAR